MELLTALLAWHPDVEPFILVSGVFAVIFFAAEILREFGKCQIETTRKFVHFSGGMVCLSFSYLLTSAWTVLILGTAFGAFLELTKKFGLLQSVHAVTRKSQGSFYFPLALFLVFVIAQRLEKPHFYLIATLVLSLSDALAALVGKSYGFKVYEVEEDQKSLEGSLMFFMSSFIIIHLGLLLLSPLGRMECVLSALYVSVLVTIFEAISLGGTDNLFIPLGTIYIMSKITTKPVEEMQYQLMIMALVFAFTFVVSMPSRKFGISGLLGVGMLGYATWSLISPDWYIPVFIGTILMTFFDIFIQKKTREERTAQIRPVFYFQASTIFWMLVTNMMLVIVKAVDHAHMQAYFLAYLVSILASFSLVWAWRSRTQPDVDIGRLPPWLVNAGPLLRAVVLTAVFLPVHLWRDPRLSAGFAITACLAGIIFSDLIFWRIVKVREEEGSWKGIQFFRMAAFLIWVVSAIVFAGALFVYPH